MCESHWSAGTGHSLYDYLWVHLLSGLSFCLKLDGCIGSADVECDVKDESGGMYSRELRVSITQLTI
jgi:hypothetical protein